jgi:hypothetical protein
VSDFRTTVYALLEDDAKLTGASNLGHSSLLNKAGAKPYGVYFRNPPADPSFPIITYFFGDQSGRFPRDVMLMITAWGSNYEEVLDRVHDLLHEATIAADDYHVLMLKWDGATSEMFSEDYRAYYCQHRYLARAIPT